MGKIYEYTCRTHESGEGDFPCERAEPMLVGDVVTIKGQKYRVKYIMPAAAPAIVPVVMLQLMIGD